MAVECVGSQRALARALGISAVAVGQWRSDGEQARDVPPKKCVCIERITQGKVSRKQLRPQDWWEIWPELSAVREASDFNEHTEESHA